jgi:hypothetical protein
VALACLAAAGCGARLTAQQRQTALAALAPAGTAAAPGAGAATPSAGVDVNAVPSAAATCAPASAGAGVAGTVAPGPVTGTGVAASTGAASARVPPRGSAPAKTSAAASTAAGTACAAGTLGASDTGVTASQINIVNASDISGPVPGLFQSAQDGVKAFVAYYNSSGQTVCGRHLNLTTLDSATSESGDHDAAVKACSSAFAMVGSESAYDEGGASVVQQCGVPDLRSSANTAARQSSPVSYGTESANEHFISSAVPDFFKQKFGDKVTQHAGFVYINVGVGQEQMRSFEGGYKAAGYKFVYTAGIDISDFNYQPYAQAMKNAGVDFIGFVGAESQAARLAQAIQQTPGFHPDVLLLQPNSYDDTYPKAAGTAANGTYVYTDAALFSEAANNPEQQLYIQWLNRVSPNVKPSWFGQFAWSAARLFVLTAQKAGPNLTRKAFLSQLQQVHAWTGNGIHAPEDVGGKRTAACFAVIQYDNGQWARQSPAPYSCGSLLETGVGG